MKNVSVARRYARALYELAQEIDNPADVLQGMSNIATALDATPDLQKSSFNPLIKPEQKKDLVAKITSNKLVLKFILLLAKRERLIQFRYIYEELRALHDKTDGISRVLVKTATPLNDTQKKSIEHELARTFGGKVIGRFEVNAELIGGMWVKSGDRVLDTSLKGRMDDMRHLLAHSHN